MQYIQGHMQHTLEHLYQDTQSARYFEDIETPEKDHRIEFNLCKCIIGYHPIQFPRPLTES